MAACTGSTVRSLCMTVDDVSALLTDMTGSDSQLWPRLMDNTTVADYNCSSNKARLLDPKCPSGGYLALHHHFSTWFHNWDSRPVDFELQDSSIRKVMYGIVSDRPQIDTWTYCTHSPTAVLHDAMRSFYVDAILWLKIIGHVGYPYPDHMDLSRTKRWVVSTKLPFVRSTCGGSSNATLTQKPWNVDFLRLARTERGRTAFDGGFNFRTATIDVALPVREYLSSRGLVSLLNLGVTPNNQTLPPILAIPVPLSDDMGSLGLMILRRLNNSWVTAACTIDARWVRGSSVIESIDYSNNLRHDNDADRSRNLVRAELDIASAYQLTDPAFIPPDDSRSTFIRLDHSWYDLAAPVIPATLVPNSALGRYHLERSTLESLLELILLPENGGPSDNDFGGIPPLRIMEHLISVQIADGLSRSGSTLNLQYSDLLTAWKYGSDGWNVWDEGQARTLVRGGEPVESFPRPPSLSADTSTRLVMKAHFQGYAMSMETWSDYLVAFVLLLHFTIAAGHTLWVVFIRGRSSPAWDTIPELIALSQKSPPADDPVLENSCAGIRSLQTLGEVARVETQAWTGPDQAGETLRLRFGGLPLKRDPISMAQVDVKYPTPNEV